MQDWLRLATLPMTTQKAAASTDQKMIIEDIKLGIWRFKISKNASKKLHESWEDSKSVFALFYQLCLDTVFVAPRLSALFLFRQIWYVIEDALKMHFSTALIRGVRGRLCLPGLSIHLLTHDLGSR